MDKHKNYFVLKKFCLQHGADLFGVADISKIKKDFMLSQKIAQRFDQGVSLGVRLSQGILEEIETAPTKLYFHHYRTVNAFLDQMALKVSNLIHKIGYSALPVPASQIIDWQNQKAHLSHKKIGLLAGLGWIGRNNLLVNRKLGSQFRVVSILTDLPLEVDKQTKEDCKICRLCVTICPAGAIKDEPEDFDYISCFNKLKEFKMQKLVEQYICGICVKICGGPDKIC